MTPDNLGKEYEDFPENVRKAAVRRYHFYQLLTKYNEYINNLLRFYLLRFSITDFFQPRKENSWGIDGLVQYIRQVLIDLNKILTQDLEKIELVVQKDIRFSWNRFYRDIPELEALLFKANAPHLQQALTDFKQTCKNDTATIELEFNEYRLPRDERLELQIYQDLKREKREKVTPDNLGKKYEDFPENVRKAAVRRYHFYQLLTKYNEEYIKRLPRHRKYLLGEWLQVSAEHWPLAKKLQDNIDKILARIEQISRYDYNTSCGQSFPVLWKLPDLWKKFDEDILTYEKSLETGKSIRYLGALNRFQAQDDIKKLAEDVPPRDERLELQIYQDLKREKREKVTPDNLGKEYKDFPENVRKAAVRRYHFYQLLTKYNEEHIKKLPRHRLLQPLQLPTTGEQLKHCHWPLAEKLQENINEILEKVEKEPARELPDLWNKFQKDILTYKTSLESAQSILYLDEFKTFQEKYKDDIRLAEEWFGDVSPVMLIN